MSEDISTGLLTNTREFLKHNLLIMVGSLPNAKGTYSFTIEEIDGCTAIRHSKFRWKSDYNINVWGLRHSRSQTKLQACLLPYQPNSTRTAILDNKESLMFTAGMTGCTFGYTRIPGGKVQVLHANFVDNDGKLDKVALSATTSHCHGRLQDHDYRETMSVPGILGRHRVAVTDVARQASMAATVIGSRASGGEWRFFAQRYEVVGTRHVYLDLLEL